MFHDKVNRFSVKDEQTPTEIQALLINKIKWSIYFEKYLPSVKVARQRSKIPKTTKEFMVQLASVRSSFLLSWVIDPCSHFYTVEKFSHTEKKRALLGIHKTTKQVERCSVNQWMTESMFFTLGRNRISGWKYIWP